MQDENKESIQTTTPKQQSWGALIAIFVVLAMIITGAFYAWGKRISTEKPTQTTNTIVNTNK